VLVAPAPMIVSIAAHPEIGRSRRVTGEPAVVVVGGGHNGLVAACYLAAAGLSVRVLERRELVGGACVTEELLPGFRASSCAFVAGPGLDPQIMRDLALSGLGLELYQTDVLACHIAESGRRLVFYREPYRTLAGLTKTYGRSEAAALVRFLVRLRMVAEIVGTYTLSEPPTLDRVRDALRRTGVIALFDEFLAGSVQDLLDRYLTADDLKALFTFLGLTSVYGGPSTPGTAYVYSHHAWGEFDGRFGEFGFARGGMGAITTALVQRARALGVAIETNAEVVRLCVKDGRVTGVVLQDGRDISADIVLANTDPKRTFLRLVDRDVLPGDLLHQVQALDFRGTMARVHVAVDRLPAFGNAKGPTDPAVRGWTVLGADRGKFERAWLAQQRNTMPDELILELTIQSVHDPTLAPPGRHIITTGIQQLPFEPEGVTWDQLRPELERRVVATLAHYMPSVEESIVGVRSITPLDLERDYALTEGNLFHGAMTLPQLFAARPLPICANSRTPIAGLYLCGAGTHPGGGVTGAPGYNAARTALNELGQPFPYGERRTPKPKARWQTIDRLLRNRALRHVCVTLGSQRAARPFVRKTWT
jgi:phytoene dehydrogenase-like protein